MTKHNNRIQVIEGLRGLAILAVLIYHLDNKLLKSGFLGVDVFFCISGFVVAYTLSTRAGQTLFEQTKTFYQRRAIRLMPALIVYLTLVRVMDSLFVPNSWLSQNNQTTAKWSFFSLANVYLSKNPDGYFSERVDFNPFVHLWSLSTENQFYLIFPIVFWISNHYFQKRILLVLFIITAILGFVALSYSSNATASYYSPLSRLWQIFAGVIAYLIWHRRSKSANYTYAWNSLFVAGAIALIFLFTRTSQTHELFLFQSMATFLTLFILISIPPQVDRKSINFQFLLESKLLRAIGSISYSLYLWHWGIFVLFRWTVGLESVFHKFLAILLALICAKISHAFFEVRFSDFLKSGNRRISFNSLMLRFTGVILVLVNVMPLNFEALSLSKSDKQQTWELKEKDKQSMKAVDSKLDLRNRKLVIIGDSHAGAYSLLSKLSELELGIETQVISLSGCPVFSFVGDSLNSPVCKDFVADVTKVAIENTREGDIVFFASLRMPRLGNQWARFDLNEIINDQESMDKNSNRQLEVDLAVDSITHLSSSKRIVLIDLPKPVFPSPIFRCLDWFNRGNAICKGGHDVERNTLLKLAHPSTQAIYEIKSRTNLEVWDPFPILCPNEVCRITTDNGSTLYFDGDHLSNAGNQILAASFNKKLRKVWEGHLG